MSGVKIRFTDDWYHANQFAESIWKALDKFHDVAHHTHYSTALDIVRHTLNKYNQYHYLSTMALTLSTIPQELREDYPDEYDQAVSGCMPLAERLWADVDWDAMANDLELTRDELLAYIEKVNE